MKVPTTVANAIREAATLRAQRKNLEDQEKPLKDLIKDFMVSQNVNEVRLADGTFANLSEYDRGSWNEGALAKALNITTDVLKKKFKKMSPVKALSCGRDGD